MLYRGAKNVIGFEISKSIIDKAIQALDSLNFSNYEFHEADEEFLNKLEPKSVDIIFEITVFQHISEEATKNYLITSKKVLKDNGLFLCQFLMNEINPIKHPYAKNKEGTVYYSHKEIENLVNDCGLHIEKYLNYNWKDENNSFWRLYIFNKK